MSSNATLEARYRARSLWLDGLPGPLTPRPSLPGDVDCDVAIVGAGFTGLWTAYYLKRADPSLRVLVLEAEQAGFGAHACANFLKTGKILPNSQVLQVVNKQNYKQAQATLAKLIAKS